MKKAYEKLILFFLMIGLFCSLYANSNSAVLEQHQIDGAQAVGDPILITSGIYIFSETDLSITIFGTTFDIGRFYKSRKGVSDNLGKNWYFTLDTRVIRGLSAEVQKESMIRDAYAKAQGKYEEALALEQELKDYYVSQKVIFEDQMRKLKVQITELELSEYKEKLTKEITDLTELLEKYEIKMLNLEEENENNCKRIKTIIESKKEDLDYFEDLIKTFQNKLKHYNINKVYNGNSINNNFDEFIECGNDVLKIFDEKGTAYTYQILAEPDYTQETNVYPNGSETKNLISGDYSKVTLNPDGSITWYREDNQIWSYGSNGLIKRMENKWGYGIDFAYNGEELDSILYRDEVLYKFTYQDGKIVKIQNQKDLSDTTIYTYDTNDFLYSVTDNEGDTVTFSYNSDNMLSSIKKPDGSSRKIKYRVVLDDEKWAYSVIDEEGRVQYVSYDLTNKKTTYIDGAGIETAYVYNNSHDTTEEHYADGTILFIEYDKNGNKTRQYYGGDKVLTAYEEKQKALNLDKSSEKYSYNSSGKITYYKNNEGVEFFFSYDKLGNVVTIRRNDNYIFKKGNNQKLLEQADNELNANPSYKIDKYGNILSVILGSLIQECSYDARNRVTSYSDGYGNTTEYAYTQKTTTEKHSNGLEKIYYYNNRKDLVKIEEKDTLTNEVRTINLVYDKTHNLLSVTNPCFLDNNGNPISLEEYTYTGNNEIQIALYKDNKDIWESIYQYDKAGKFLGSVPTKNEEIVSDENLIGRYKNVIYKIDTIGRDIFSINPIMKSSPAIFSKIGKDYATYVNENLISFEKQTNDFVAVEYHDNGNVKSVTDKFGNKTEYFYNASGLLEITLSNKDVKFYFYNMAGRIVGQYIKEYDMEDEDSGSGLYIKYSYEDNGRTVVLNYDGLYSKIIKLNAFGEIVEIIDNEGNIIKYEYDSLGRQIAVCDENFNLTKYEYNALGLISKVIKSDNSIEFYEYDKFGNISTIIDEKGVKVEYSYDNLGILLSTNERAEN